MSATYLTPESVSLSGVTVRVVEIDRQYFRGGRCDLHDVTTERRQTVKWTTLLAAATQDDESLAGVYRDVLSQARPMLARAAEEAYVAYCQSSVTTRTTSGVHAVGHGSWVTGPDGELQSLYLGLREVERQTDAVLSVAGERP